MADEPEEAKVGSKNLVPGDRITVVVDSALPDIVVVSYTRGNKIFQGALLDATKRGLPCGIEPPEPVKGPDGDKLASIASRFSYFQEKKYSTLTKTDLRRHANSPTKSKNARPTVRLRPRQVLCSKCSSICNENNENVGRKRKLDERHSHVDQPTRRSDRRCSSTTQQQQNQHTPPTHHLNTRSQRLPNGCDQLDESSSSKTTSSLSSTTPTTSSRQQTDDSKFSPSLIPKISRLRAGELNGAIQTADSVKSCIKLAEEVRSAYWNGRDEEDLNEAEAELENRPMNGPTSTQSKKPRTDQQPMELETQAYCATPRRNSSSSVESAKIPDEDDKKTLAAADSTVKGNSRSLRVLRKKRSIGLMEDLWDESVFEDSSRTTSTTTTTTATPTARATPIIKISFGAQGEGTVLKIPSKIQDPYLVRDIDTDTEDMHMETDKDPLGVPKSYAADAFIGCEADGQEQIDPQKQSLLIKDCETASAKAAKKALKKAKKKALKKMYGATSPARSPCNGSPRYNSNFDIMYHRRKHKVKHKKKHKEERKHKNQNPQELQQPDCLDSSLQPMPELLHAPVENPDGTYTSIKEQCLKQKLSISLKRLNTNAYAANCDYPVSNASSGFKTPGATSEDEDDEVGHEVAGETAPDFPPPEHPLVMRMAASSTPMAHCALSNGRKMDVGDVVWGKVHGFPWWPGKVLSLTTLSKEDPAPQAHVAWYGSSTSSVMPCEQLSPFLETFKTRFNKKKKGPYKEAIRQAQEEARSQIAPNSTNSVLSVCGSPREVNVFS